MSLKPSPINQIPEETIRVSKAVFPKGNRYILLRDTFGNLFEMADFQHLFSKEGKPAENPARLAVITILQFAEQLSDERAADAVRSRIDLKYLLALPLEDSGFDSSVLCEFRARLKGTTSCWCSTNFLNVFTRISFYVNEASNALTPRMC